MPHFTLGGRNVAATPCAQGHFDRFAQGQQREYLEWMTEVKTNATRDKRIAQAVEWIAEGRKRHWKYEKC